MKPIWTRRLLVLHRWCGLISAANLAILCVTGALLVFVHEIDTLLATEERAEDVQPGPIAPLLHEIVAAHPDHHIGSLRPPHEPGDPYQVALHSDDDFLRLELDPGRGTWRPSIDRGGVTEWLLDLHVHLFLGLPGQILVGLMGTVWFIGTLAGMLLYGPFSGKRALGQVRAGRRRWWADWHRLLGAATSAWGLIVGLSGVLLALSFIPIQAYAYTELKALAPALSEVDGLVSLDQIDEMLETGQAALPSHHMTSLSWPGSTQGDHAFLVLGHGDGRFGENTFEAVLLRADTGEVVKVLDLPLVLQVISASGPFHFGNFGGLGGQVLYAGLSLASLGLVVTGILSWWRRRRR